MVENDNIGFERRKIKYIIIKGFNEIKIEDDKNMKRIILLGKMI